MGSRVTMTACGRGHTLALVGNRVYVFGLAGCGQLGLGKDVNQYRLVPTCLRMDQKIIGVFAGGDHSFIVFDEVRRRKIFATKIKEILVTSDILS